MLKDLTAQICSACGSENPINPSALEVSGMDGNIIALPPCDCGAREFLRVTTVQENPGDHAELVRQFAKTLPKRRKAA